MKSTLIIYKTKSTEKNTTETLYKMCIKMQTVK